MRGQYLAGLRTLEQQRDKLKLEASQAVTEHAKVRNAETVSHLASLNQNIADVELARQQLAVTGRQFQMPAWVTLPWTRNIGTKPSHALFILGAAASALSLTALSFWPRAGRVLFSWIIFAAVIAANSVFGLILLFR